MIAVETKEFISISDDLKQQLNSLDVADSATTREFVSRLISFNARFNNSSICRYMDEKSEIRVFNPIQFYYRPV